MKLRKLLSLALTLSLLVSVFPAVAYSEETENNAVERAESAVLDNLFLDKNATLENDGTYTIDLSAYATGTTISKTVTEGVPLDVVLVMDQSGSLVSNDKMLTGLKQSVNSFLEALRANGDEYGVDHRVAICGFASHSMQNNSGLIVDDYSYSNDTRDNAWTNTGIFVDGEFRDYGTVTYTKVTSVSISEIYTIKGKLGGSNVEEYAAVYYNSSYGAWYIISNGRLAADSGYYNINGQGIYLDDNEALLALYDVYTAKNSRNLLNNNDYAAAWEYISNGQGGINSYIETAVSHLSSNGATATFMGMKMARKMLENLPAETDGVDRKKIVIVFTDGEPGANGYAKGDAYAALAEADRIKADGTEIYTIGIYSAASANNVDTFMNYLSSNYADLTYTATPRTLDYEEYRVNPSASTNGYVGYSYSGDMYYYKGIDGQLYGLSTYFLKEGDHYCPVYIHYDVNNSKYYACYITDDGEYRIASPNEAKYYQLNTITPMSNDYYKYASDIDELSSIFETISFDMTGFTSELSLDANAVLKDVLADGFALTGNTTVTVSVVLGSMQNGTITWGDPQQVLSFDYPNETQGSGNVVVPGAADQTQMTLTAKATADGVVTVTGFNYAKAEDANQIKAQYISEGHPGSKLVVTITGVEANANATTDAMISTNKGISGIYEGAESDTDADGTRGELQATFPLPTTYLSSKVYVVDYAKPMTIEPSDFFMNQDAITLDEEGYRHYETATTEFDQTYGKVSMADGRITYQPTNMNWKGYDTFYVFGTTEDSTVTAADANRDGNMWAKVSVIPANNVYYEDTFVTNEEAGTVGILYNGDWEQVDAEGDPAEGGENAESGEDTNLGGVHGWEDTLADDTSFTDGSAYVSSTSGATATFTFTGTGVDIYSRTNDCTGIVLAMLYEGESTSPIARYSIMVDNLAASGDYFQVPTLSLCKIPLKVDGQIQKNENGETIMTVLPHSTYTVKLIVSKASASQTGQPRLLYYLDGIRVYNPIKPLEKEDETVSDAYGEAELNATFVEIRDNLLDANSFSAEGDASAGPVFIDRITSEDGSHEDGTQTIEIGTYEIFGPKNEVYLSQGQMITFAVEPQEGAHYYIGMKSLTGSPVNAALYNANGVLSQVQISHTSDLYYEVFPVAKTDASGNTIHIISVNIPAPTGFDGGEGQTGNDLLSLTKLKATGPEMTSFRFAMVRNADLLNYATMVYSTSSFNGTHPGPAEDPTVPSEPTEPSEPVEPTEPEVEIENPGKDTSENEDNLLQKLMFAMLDRIFSDLRSWFRR